MTKLTGRPKLAGVAVLTFAVVLISLRLLGAFTVGAVVTDSMEPDMPVGTLFLSLPISPSEDSLVVFSAPSGERVVHRVVDVDPEGLTTKGDANRATDQEAGLPKVDPDETQVIPEPFGRPLTLTTPVKGVALIAVSQLLVLAFAIFGGIRMTRKKTRLRPHHLLFAVALILLLSAPLFERKFDEPEQIHISASFVDVVAHAKNGNESEVWQLKAFEEKTTSIQGPGTVMIAPALPGAKLLVPYGAMAAFLPLSIAVALVALLFRMGGA